MQHLEEHFGQEALVAEGELTELGLEILRRMRPEIDPSHFRPGVRVEEINRLLTAQTFVRLVLRLWKPRAKCSRRCKRTVAEAVAVATFATQMWHPNSLAMIAVRFFRYPAATIHSCRTSYRWASTMAVENTFRRVVVTGMGLATSLGLEVRPVWDAIVSGRPVSGIFGSSTAADFPSTSVVRWIQTAFHRSLLTNPCCWLTGRCASPSGRRLRHGKTPLSRMCPLTVPGRVFVWGRASFPQWRIESRASPCKKLELA